MSHYGLRQRNSKEAQAKHLHSCQHHPVGLQAAPFPDGAACWTSLALPSGPGPPTNTNTNEDC